MLSLRAESCITNGFFRFASLNWRKEFEQDIISAVLLSCTEDRKMYIPWIPRFFLPEGQKFCITNDLLRFASLDWRKEYAQLIDSFVLFISIQERNLQISSLLRFGFLRLKEVIWVTHDLFGFESLNWRKERMYARVSSVLLPEIEKRNMCNLWFSQFWFLSAGVSSVFFP